MSENSENNTNVLIPQNETERLQALYSYQILDTEPEPDFDNLTKVLSYICQVPIVLISLVDRDRTWFLSKIGLEANESSRQSSICQHAIMDRNIFEIEDALNDSRFQNLTMVQESPNIRFYAGMPLATPDGLNIGALCLIDNKPNKLNDEQREILGIFSRQIIQNLELRNKNRDLHHLRIQEQATLKSKSQFFAHLSHEIRTPVHGILGFSKLLSETKLSDQQKDYLHSIYASGDILLNIVNDILDYSKIESGNMILESISFDLCDAVNELCNLFKPMADEKRIGFSQKFDTPNGLVVRGDILRIKQILINLLSNAIKFTSKGEVILSLRTEEQSSELVFFEIKIKDTGIGIPTEKLGQLFREYTQADSSVSRNYGGTGLGLAICKSLAEKMGFDIAVESILQKGSTFRFSGTLPRGESKEISKIHKSEEGKEIDLSAYQLKVLVAEDNEINQHLIEGMLRKLGINPVIVSDGLQVLEYLSSRSVDILFLDIQMPELNGIETAKKISAFSEKPYIIAMTANAGASDKKESLAAGMDDYVSKPFDKDIIYEILKKFVSDKRKRD